MLRPALLALCLAHAGCATLAGSAPSPQPLALSPGPVQCTAATVAAASWPTLEAYVRAVLEAQRAAACMPVPAPEPTPLSPVPVQ